MRLWGEGSGGGREGDEVLYGTQTGRVGLVQLTAEEPNYCWDMLNDRKSVSCLLLNVNVSRYAASPLSPTLSVVYVCLYRYGGVSCLSTFDLSGDGVEEIVVGRDDGVVEVYSMNDSDQPRLKFTHVSTTTYIVNPINKVFTKFIHHLMFSVTCCFVPR